jgi:hypothetical protein
MARLPKVKLRAIPVFPSDVQAVAPILLEKVGAEFTFSLDINSVADSLSVIFAPLDTSVDQVVTSGASVAVSQNARTVVVNKTVGGATALALPDAHLKTCPVLISDFKGDAGTNNITITTTGTDKFPGGLTTWTISADTGSIFLRPIPGVGYAL